MEEREELTASPEFWKITACRSCGSEHLQEVLSLGKQHLAGWSEKQIKPTFAPLNLCRCESCNLVQLEHTTEPKLLWNDNYGYRSGINNTIRQDLKEIAGSVTKIADIRSGDIVVDIGANDGTLLDSYHDSLKIMRVGYEPVDAMKPYFLDSVGKRGIGQYMLFSQFFDKWPYLRQFGEKSAKAVTAISMFYDLDDPNKFLEDVKEILHPEGVLVIQQNYLPRMLEQNAFDNIVHEHLEYYSLGSLEPLLNKHELEVFDVSENKINGGSLRTYIRQKGASVESRQGQERLWRVRKNEEEAHLDDEKTYKDFAGRVQRATFKLRNFVENEVLSGKEVYAYGASTRGNTLLQAAQLNSFLIAGAAERNPDKWGKVTVGTNIPIYSEEEARKNADSFLVLPWFFKEEFIKRETEFLNGGGELIFPLPEPHIVYRTIVNKTMESYL